MTATTFDESRIHPRDEVIPGPSARLSSPDGTGIRASYRWVAGERRIHGDLGFGAGTEGLPGFVHGGALAAVADEAMGMACWMMGYCGPGVRIELDFRRGLVPGSTARLEAWLEGVEGRKLHARARVVDAEGPVLDAKGLFVSIQPPDWERFSGMPGLDRFTVAARSATESR